MSFMMPCEHRTATDLLGMGIQQDSEQAQDRQADDYEYLGHRQPKKPHFQLCKNLLATQKKKAIVIQEAQNSSRICYIFSYSSYNTSL